MEFIPFSLDPRDIFYSIIGLALLGLTFQPVLRKFRLVNLPLIYVAIGAVLAFLGIPGLNPQNGGLSAKVIEHAAELIVIISLAGAGLAIDTKETWRNWQAAYRLILVSMPLTILAIFFFGWLVVGMPWPSAMLLAAVMAPTDPVLARSVQVGPPGHKEKPMEVALTAEAGLNDGLAFPFVYLALAAAAAGYMGDGWPQWGWSWFSYDLLYRVIAGWCIGWVCGLMIARLVTSRFGDASQGAWNSIIVVLSSTLIAYGVTESFDAYGFLAVFAATRAGRSRSRETQKQAYEKYVHHGADQLESILLALLLLWFGTYVASGVLTDLIWTEVVLALMIVFVFRPLTGMLALIKLECEDLQRFKVAFFGIRGMGTIFYIVYAQNHGAFSDIDTVWRIAALTILISMIVHGFAANFVLDEAGHEQHPHKTHLPEVHERG